MIKLADSIRIELKLGENASKHIAIKEISPPRAVAQPLTMLALPGSISVETFRLRQRIVHADDVNSRWYLRSDLLRVPGERDGEFALITIHRPEALNAFGDGLELALISRRVARVAPPKVARGR